MLADFKKLWHGRSHLAWKEWVDGAAHAIGVPYKIQTRLCDWVDNSYYK